MNELIIKDNIENMIYEIRGVQVMLDSDLARLYECRNGTKEINQAIKNNPEKFPERFAFRITEEEYKNLKSKYLTSSSNNNYGGSRKGHTVFTRQGILMLATILKSNIAVEITIEIMDAFVVMHKYISNNLIEQKYINNQVMKNTEDIRLLQESFDKLNEKRRDNEIYFNGQIYDAYSKIIDILKEAKEKIIIIDSYADKEILDIIRNIKTKVVIITKKNNLLTNKDIEKYNQQYNNLEVKYDNTYHDRYFILDKQVVYHCGTSLNRIGYKTFSITRINDKNITSMLINNIDNN